MHFAEIDTRNSFLLCVVEFPGLQAHFATDQRVVCVAVATVVGTCDEHALEGGASHDNHVQLVTELGPRVSPGDLI